MLKILTETQRKKAQRKRIDSICNRYKIKNYIINDDGSIDVNGKVDLYRCHLNILPIKFNKVEGHFDCRYNNLTTLENCPEYIGGNFLCVDNLINTLRFFPKVVKGEIYYYEYNRLPGEFNYLMWRFDDEFKLTILKYMNYYGVWDGKDMEIGGFDKNSFSDLLYEITDGLR